MGMWDKIKSATVTPSSDYFLSGENGAPGNYEVQITGLKTNDGQKGLFAVIECTVISSNVKARPAGAKMAQLIKLTQEMGPINVKAFVGALLGFDASKCSAEATNELIVERFATLVDKRLEIDEICAIVFSAGSPFEDQVMQCTARTITTKVSKQPFTKIEWTPADGW